jgi:hypothetical protein
MSTNVEQLAERIRAMSIDQKLLMASMLAKQGEFVKAEAIASLAVDEMVTLRILRKRA